LRQGYLVTALPHWHVAEQWHVHRGYGPALLYCASNTEKAEVEKVDGHAGFQVPASEAEQPQNGRRFVLSLEQTMAAAAAAAATAAVFVALAVVTPSELLTAWSSGDAVVMAKNCCGSLQAVVSLALPMTTLVGPSNAAAAVSMPMPMQIC